MGCFMDIAISRATAADAEDLLRHLKAAGAETDNLSFGKEGIPITVEAEEEYLANVENSRDGIVFVAKVRGKIIGEASLNRLPRRMGHRGELGISVAKAFWNNGVGSALLEQIIYFAKQNGFYIIDLQVRSDNLAAIHLYQKYGFQKFCTYPSFFKIDDSFIDFDFMSLRLR